MRMPTTGPYATDPDLPEDLRGLRNHVLSRGAANLARYHGRATEAPSGMVNLAHYLALRSVDLRGLQRRLMVQGLSSLGRLESRVLPTLDAVLRAAEILNGQTPTVEPTDARTYFAGEQALRQATDALFGPPPADRAGRIMVTMQADVAERPGLALQYVRAGMNVARINCAHDDPDTWSAIARHVRTAAQRCKCHVPIHMDIAGPKIRTLEVAAREKERRIQPGDTLRLVTEGEVHATKEAPFCARIALPGLLSRLSVGDHFAYDDGRLLGQVTTVTPRGALVRILHARSGGARLKPEKGVNFPDTELDLSALTDQDRADLDTVVGLADIVGYSFVSEAGDIDLLEDALAKRPRSLPTLGLVAKIERPQAVRNLPVLIGRASGVRPFGVMIARGDLAAELGFERMAEMQEELLWLCEAAHVPVIWATQVLETLVKDGVPSRGEMTDAAMATRAECIMLNKGPEVVRAIGLLDRLYRRMDGHMHKKTPTLRALRAFEPQLNSTPPNTPRPRKSTAGVSHADHESRSVRRARANRSHRKARS